MVYILVYNINYEIIILILSLGLPARIARACWNISLPNIVYQIPTLARATVINDKSNLKREKTV